MERGHRLGPERHRVEARPVDAAWLSAMGDGVDREVLGGERI